MKWLNRLAALLFGLISVGIIRDFFNKHTIIVLDKEENLEEDDEDANSIASILTEWSGDHAAELLRDGTTSTEIPTTFDIDLNGEFATSTEKKSDRFKIV